MVSGGLQNTVVDPGDTTIDLTASNLIETFTSIGAGEIAAGQNTLVGNPELVPLAYNGGPTPTHALLPTSPAIDTAQGTCPPTDQRGEARPSGVACDIGAFELVTPPKDVTSPVLSLPGDITKEAEGPSGATVSWSAPTATDDVDGTVTVNCDKTSGDTFPLRTTTVTCSATDAAGNTFTGTFDVTVQDTTPPDISGMPSNITKEATDPSGATASWSAPTTSDTVDGTVGVTCTPDSGSTFALGTTTVNCSATDAAGNTTRGSFNVTVVAATDTTAPTVFSTNPGGNHGTMTNRASNVTATFSEDVQNVNATTFKLEQVKVSRKGVETTSPVAATVTSASGTVTQGASATLNPSKDLQKGSTYRATLTSGVTDTAGNALSAPYTWTFQVSR
jgi:hypothetical protein